MNTIIFGLETRGDRWQRCLEILEEEGIEKVTRFTTTINFNDKHRQSSKDFLKCLELKRGEDLMFFEDDFELVPGWRDVLRKAQDCLPSDFDLLYLGCNLTETPTKITENLYKVRGAWMFHGVILSTKFIEYVLRVYDVNRVWCFDEWCRIIAPERRFYMTFPHVCYQRPGYSDFTGQYVNYKKIQFNNKIYQSL